MKKVYWYIAGLVIMIMSHLNSYSQENILFFMGNTPQSNYLNPSRITDNSKVVIDLPLFSGFDFSLNNSFSFHDLASVKDHILTIDIGKFYQNIPSSNYFSESLKIPLFDLQIRLKNRSISMGIFENQLLRTKFDNNLIRLFNEGNYPWLGTTYSTGFDFNFLHYREYYLGYSQPVIKNLSVGGRVKLLTGFSIFDLDRLDIDIESGTNMEYLKFNASGSYYMSLPFLPDVGGDPESGNSNFDIVHYFSNFSNPGIAFDIGATYQILPKLSISASVTDLGFIRWKDKAQKISHHGSFNWQGFDLTNITNASGYSEAPYLAPLQSLMDSLSDLMNFTINENPFSNGIPTKVFIAAGYQVFKVLEAGIVDRIQIYDKQVSNALTISANLKLGTVWSLSAGYSIIDNSFDNLSLGTALKLGPFEFYCLTDNILALNILDARNSSLRIGLNFMFGKIASQEE